MHQHMEIVNAETDRVVQPHTKIKGSWDICLKKLGHHDMILASKQLFGKVQRNNYVKSMLKQTIYVFERNSERELPPFGLASFPKEQPILMKFETEKHSHFCDRAF